MMNFNPIKFICIQVIKTNMFQSRNNPDPNLLGSIGFLACVVVATKLVCHNERESQVRFKISTKDDVKIDMSGNIID